MKFDFQYRLGSDTGFCHGISVPQAEDNAKLRWLASKGIRITSPNFYIEKAKAPKPTLKLTPLQDQRFKELYRCAKDASLSAAEQAELSALQKVIRNL